MEGFVISLFVPATYGILFIPGLTASTIGLIIIMLALYSFAYNLGLGTTKIYQYSKNLNYIGWTIFMGSLAVIG
ncbi:MAG: hypothetical protein EAX86_11635 [Candidatus Heimdallarchaeota archaeon]|nr:hypothetical protein [Candidatus Heimdallarchaeota archaeon]